MAAHRKTGKELSCVKGQYRRTIGQWKNRKGKIAPKRFLLGRDQRKAEQANLKLEQLWEMVLQTVALRAQTRVEAFRPPGEPEPVPLWDGYELEIAEAIRHHHHTMRVDMPDNREGEAAYASHLHYLQQSYGHLMSFEPALPELLKRGQEVYAGHAEDRARKARLAASIAGASIPDGTGQTLYQAIDAYADYCERTGSGGQKEPEDAIRLKNALGDIPLERFNYDAILRMGDYWRSRPPTRRPGGNGQPIAARTAINRLKTAKRFIRWLHRSDTWQWRKPDEFEEALRTREDRLLTEEEKLSKGEGPETWTVQELATLYRYATDRERVLMLLGLNLGFAQSEIESFRLEDVKDGDLPHVLRLRRKTQKLCGGALWPETVAAIEWLGEQRAPVEPEGNVWVVLSEKGKRLKRGRIANQWNGLLDRVQRDQPGFRRLSFKYLRKTAYQLVLEASGSHEVAGTFEGRGSLSTDQYQDAYGRRLFDRVWQAHEKVRERLAPVFDGVSGAFQGARKKGGGNITKAQIQEIQRLWRDDVPPAEIAQVTGLSRTTVYRHGPSDVPGGDSCGPGAEA